MPFLSRSPYPTPPRNLCGLLLRDVASLLVTSELVSRALIALRPECGFSHELTRSLDLIVALSDAGQIHLQEPLAEAGAVLPHSHDTCVSARARAEACIADVGESAALQGA